MKPLGTLKKQLILMSILQPTTRIERIFYSISYVALLGSGATYSITTLWFIAFEAQTFAEYAECSYIALSASMITNRLVLIITLEWK